MVDILLSTYNGERFLPDQIESILSQNFSDWRLLIRDDGSSDATEEIIKKYAKHPKIVLHEDGIGHVGVKKSFEILLRASSAKHIMFCDQDDMWLSHKITTMMDCIEREESKEACPCLVVSDLTVIDEKNCKIAESFWKYRRLSPIQCGSLNSIIIQNKFPGCSMLFNRELKDVALNIPNGAILHDWWIALVASAFGRIVVVSSPLLHYRQHQSNVLGISEVNVLKNILRIFTKNNEVMKNLRNLSDLQERVQCSAFMKQYHNTLPQKQRCILESFSNLSIFKMFKNRIFCQPWETNINLYFIIIFLKVRRRVCEHAK